MVTVNFPLVGHTIASTTAQVINDEITAQKNGNTFSEANPLILKFAPGTYVLDAPIVIPSHVEVRNSSDFAVGNFPNEEIYTGATLTAVNPVFGTAADFARFEPSLGTNLTEVFKIEDEAQNIRFDRLFISGRSRCDRLIFGRNVHDVYIFACRFERWNLGVEIISDANGPADQIRIVRCFFRLPAVPATRHAIQLHTTRAGEMDEKWIDDIVIRDSRIEGNNEAFKSNPIPPEISGTADQLALQGVENATISKVYSLGGGENGFAFSRGCKSISMDHSWGTEADAHGIQVGNSWSLIELPNPSGWQQADFTSGASGPALSYDAQVYTSNDPNSNPYHVRLIGVSANGRRLLIDAARHTTVNRAFPRLDLGAGTGSDRQNNSVSSYKIVWSTTPSVVTSTSTPDIPAVDAPGQHATIQSLVRKSADTITLNGDCRFLDNGKDKLGHDVDFAGIFLTQCDSVILEECVSENTVSTSQDFGVIANSTKDLDDRFLSADRDNNTDGEFRFDTYTASRKITP